jgi:hypothetical protein
LLFYYYCYYYYYYYHCHPHGCKVVSHYTFDLQSSNDSWEQGCRSDTCYNTVKPETMMLSERSQSKKATYCRIPFMWTVWNRQIHRWPSGEWIPAAKGKRGTGRDCLMDPESLLGVMKTFGSGLWCLCQCCNCTCAL